MRVLILYNEPVLAAGHPEYESEHEILATVAHVQRWLTEAGFEVGALGVGADPGPLLAEVRDRRPHAVFNLFEGTGDQSVSEALVAGLLDWLRLPYTGSPFVALGLARDKQLTKHLLQGAGLPTPRAFAVDGPNLPDCRLDWPVIVKPARQDASIGLDQGSVITDRDRLGERVALLLEKYGPPVLVEEYIAGRELNVALVETPELRPLPISEIMFLDTGPSYWPIVTYDAKWRPGSRDFEATPPRYPADVDTALADRLTELARRAFRLLGCRDYARVDFRVRPDGSLFILEVNPNPDYSPDAGFAGGLRCGGFTQAQFTVQLVHNALGRSS